MTICGTSGDDLCAACDELCYSVGEQDEMSNSIEFRPRCPACAKGVQCVVCYLDSLSLRQLEDERTLMMEGYAAIDPSA